MRGDRVRLRVLALAALLAAVTACDGPAADGGSAAPISCAAGAVTGQGSSAQAGALNTWIRDYQVSCPDATISYASVGSGAGVRAFLAGDGDFAGTDSPLAGADRRGADARCRGAALHLPLVAGPIALAYNVAGVDALRLAPDTIAGLFSGRVRSWDDPVVRRDNPGVTLPATPVRPVHRADNSGTTGNFTRFLAATAAGSWPHGAGSTWPAPGSPAPGSPASRGIAAKGSNRVVAAIERTDGAIGYVEGSYAVFHELPVAQVRNAAGEFTALTEAAAARTLAGARLTGTGGDLQLAIDHAAPVAGGYPLVMVSYEVVCRTGTAAPAKSFLAYASSPAGQQAASRLGSVPLPEGLRAQVAAAVGRL